MVGSGQDWVGSTWSEVVGSGRKWSGVVGVVGSGREWSGVVGSGREWPVSIPEP